MTAKPIKKRRTRLSRELRQDMILDHAAKLIRESGVSALNMERISKEAGVSKPLMYNYFSNVTELMKALLVRETEIRRDNNRRIAEATSSFEEMVRETSRAMLEYVRDAGVIYEHLILEPEVAAVLQELGVESHERHIEYLLQRLHDEYSIPNEIAEITIELGLGISTAAATMLEKRGGQDFRLIEDVLVTMLLSSLSGVSKRCENGGFIHRAKRTSSAS
ncbi:MAG: TetR/AcrR family transcriptional regulator [Pseudomonadota bacterium]